MTPEELFACILAEEDIEKQDEMVKIYLSISK